MRLPLISLLVISTTTVVGWTNQATAQLRPEGTTQAIERAFFEESGDIYSNSFLDRQFKHIFALEMPEYEYLRDAGRMNRLYRQGMKQQGEGDGVIRTPDLPNPYNTSIYSDPNLMR